MSYNDVAKMTASAGLNGRCTACAAQEFNTRGVRLASVPNWVRQNIWIIASTTGWDAKWVSGEAAYQGEDVGIKEDVITDADILSVVQPLVIEDTAEPA